MRDLLWQTSSSFQCKCMKVKKNTARFNKFYGLYFESCRVILIKKVDVLLFITALCSNMDFCLLI